MKVGVEEFVAQKGTWPVAIGAANPVNLDIDAPSGKYVASGGVVLATGTITVTFDNGATSVANKIIRGRTIALRPFFSAGPGVGNIVWQCQACLLYTSPS